MQKNHRILLLEPAADCSREIVEQIASELSSLVHRVVVDTTDLALAMQEENWDSIVCSDSLAASTPLHSILSHLPGMACQIRLGADNALHFPYISEGCSTLFGIASLEVELHPDLLLTMLHPEDRAAFYNSMHESIKRASQWNWQGRFVLAHSNETKWVDLSATHCGTTSHGTLWDGFMTDTTHNKLAENEIYQSRQRLRELSSHVEDIKEKERLRIAREIHDEIGVLLTALKLDLAWLTNRLPADNRALHEKVQDMADLLDTAGSAANNLVHSLRPGFLDCFGIVAAIEIEAKEFTKRTGIPCKVIKSEHDVELPDDLPITIFRVFQETMNNIMKHAEARQVQVNINVGPERIDLTVADDGKGFDASSREKPRSFGLRGIQERIGHLGGQVKITSEPGKGAQISVWLPLEYDGRTIDHDSLQSTLF